MYQGRLLFTLLWIVVVGCKTPGDRKTGEGTKQLVENSDKPEMPTNENKLSFQSEDSIKKQKPRDPDKRFPYKRKLDKGVVTFDPQKGELPPKPLPGIIDQKISAASSEALGCDIPGHNGMVKLNTYIKGDVGLGYGEEEYLVTCSASVVSLSVGQNNVTTVELYSAAHCFVDETNPNNLLYATHILLNGREPDSFTYNLPCGQDFAKITAVYNQLEAGFVPVNKIRKFTNKSEVADLIGKNALHLGYPGFSNKAYCGRIFTLRELATSQFVINDGTSIEDGGPWEPSGIALTTRSESGYSRPEICDYTDNWECIAGMSGGPIYVCDPSNNQLTLVGALTNVQDALSETPVNILYGTAILTDDHPKWDPNQSEGSCAVEKSHTYSDSQKIRFTNCRISSFPAVQF